MNEKQTKIGFQLKAVNNLIRRNLDARFVGEELEELCGMQGPMIGYIYDHSRQGPVFQKDLEKAFHVRRSTATVMLQNLEQKGYIVRESMDYDARLKKIVLTEKAVKNNLEIRRRIDEFHEELEYGITEEERKEFLRILGKVRANLE